MKLVEFTRDMAPHGRGDTRFLPDDVAERLIGAGDAIPRASILDSPKQSHVTQALARRQGQRRSRP